MADQQEININETVDSIAGDLGLGKGDDHHEDETTSVVDTGTETAAVTAETATTAAAAAKTDAAAASPAVRAAPKAWAKETHELWSKLTPEAQTQIEHREKQMLDGLTQYSESAKQAKAYQDVVSPYLPLIQAQGVDAPQAIRYLLEAHKNLSQGTPEQRAAYLETIAKSYGITGVKGAAPAADETPAMKGLRERTERLERARQNEMDDAQRHTAERITKQVTDFAEAKDDKGAPKHPYFDECSEHIVKLIHGGYALEEAYRIAIYANPVTQAKELARLQTESEAALRAKAVKEADAARNASRTNVNSRDTRRAPTASKANGWEDTLDATMQEIKARTN